MSKTMIGCTLVALGVAVMLIGIVGTFRFRYVLNRMHAAALNDTLGLVLVLIGLMVLVGISWQSLKLRSSIVFMWLASPVMSPLIGRAEVLTHPQITDECEVITHEDSL